MQVALVVFQLQGILLSGLKLFLAYKRPAAEMAWCPTYAVWLAAIGAITLVHIRKYRTYEAGPIE